MENRDRKLQPALEMQGITKTFPGLKALDQVNLTAYAGEIHALMGENGAGKSTLMKILAGAYRADQGQIRLDGEQVVLRSPLDAKRLGVSLIYQELNLAPNLTVAENIFLGSEPVRGFVVDRRLMRRETAQVLETLGATFDANAVTGSLSIAEQQMVEIARALYVKSRVLVMDEPTTALSDRETVRLFEIVRRLRDDGIAVVYISHRMNEVYELADRVTVLRDGRFVGELSREELSAERLVKMMVGRDVQDFYKNEHEREAGDEVLTVEGLTDGEWVQPSSFLLRSGEIVGLAGLVGAGRTELARLIFGADPAKSGEVRLEGRKLEIRGPKDAMREGIGYVPEDRKALGLFLEMNARENIVMSVLDRDSKLALVDFTEAKRRTRAAIDALNIRVASQRARAVGLSGGNQQKLLVARWLEIAPKVLLLDEPTRGVDVGAKGEIYRIMDELASHGVSILFISSELPEIIGMSDRVLVMREGRLVAELTGEEIDQETIIAHATGAKEVA
jgi:ribose transport system ATP-binding protein